MDCSKSIMILTSVYQNEAEDGLKCWLSQSPYPGLKPWPSKHLEELNGMLDSSPDTNTSIELL